MMSEHEKIEKLLKCTRLVKPDENLRKRVLGVSRKEWSNEEGVFGWRPLLGFGGQVALSVLLISFANRTSMPSVKPQDEKVEARSFQERISLVLAKREERKRIIAMIRMHDYFPK